MTYSELIAKLREIEAKTGVYLSDTSVDRENAPRNASDAELFEVAASAAGFRAEEAGLNINKLIGSTIY